MRQRLNLIERLLAAIRHTAHERPVKRIDLGRELLPLVVTQRSVFGINVSIAASGEELRIHADLVVEAVQVEARENHADGPGERVRIRNDRIAGHGHIVAARRGFVAHRDHQRLLLAEVLGLVQHLIGGHGIAAGGIDAQNHALD